ncbi:MAG: hypothetical protein GY906_23125 [bacterium]|nr:hypothetical protein [bacterium]
MVSIGKRESGPRETAVVRITTPYTECIGPRVKLERTLSELFGGFTRFVIEGGWLPPGFEQNDRYWAEDERRSEREIGYQWEIGFTTTYGLRGQRRREMLEGVFAVYAEAIGATWVHLEYRRSTAAHFEVLSTPSEPQANQKHNPSERFDVV